jgi:hypothetical protein
VVSFALRRIDQMILTRCYRVLPTKRQHRALERLLEAQRQLYNAALEERIDAYRKIGITRTYMDQCRGLTDGAKVTRKLLQSPSTFNVGR